MQNQPNVECQCGPRFKAGIEAIAITGVCEAQLDVTLSTDDPRNPKTRSNPGYMEISFSDTQEKHNTEKRVRGGGFLIAKIPTAFQKALGNPRASPFLS